MALDLRIELFASDLFHTIWYHDGMITTKDNASFKYVQEYKKDPDYEEVFDEAYLFAVKCRMYLFSRVYFQEICGIDMPSIFSYSDFYDYILDECECKNLFDGLTIFERFFASCAFVAILCQYFYAGNLQTVTSIGHLCWAMYFDKSSVEFYNLGGWRQLGRVAASYVWPREFLCYFKYHISLHNVLNKTGIALHDFKHFLQSTKFTNRQITKSWVRFHLEKRIKLDEVVFPHCEENAFSSKVMEKLLQDLKVQCDPCASAILEYDFKEQSKTELIGCDSSKFPSPAANQKNTLSEEVENVKTSTEAANVKVGTDSLSTVYVDEIQSHMPINAPVRSPQLKSAQNLPFIPDTTRNYISNNIPSDYVASKLPCRVTDTSHLQSLPPRLVSTLDSAETSVGLLASLFDSLNLEGKVEHRFEQQHDENMQTFPKDGVDQNSFGILPTARDNLQDKSNPDALFPSARLANISNLDISPCKEISQQQSKTNLQNPFKSTRLPFSESLPSTICDTETMNRFMNPKTNCGEFASKLTVIEHSLKKKITESKVNTYGFSQNASFLEEAVPSNVSGKVKKKRKRKNYVRNEPKTQIEQPEQKTDDVTDLLRMILALGDRNAIRYVLSTSHNSSEAQSKN